MQNYFWMKLSTDRTFRNLIIIVYTMLLFAFSLITSFALSAVQAEAVESQSLPVVVVRHIAMATDFELIIYGNHPEDDPEALREYGREAFVSVDKLEDEISIWRPNSQASRINRDASSHPVKLSSDMLSLLNESERYYHKTEGAFDITVGPLMELWGFTRKQGIQPSEQALQVTLKSVGFHHIQLDSEERTVYFTRAGMRIDFGGIGKGMALDRLAAILSNQGIKSARLNGGSSTIIGLCAPPGKPGWTVDIRSPYNSEDSAPVARVTICDEAMSTSSGSERYIEIDNKRYGHILDPRTGWPTSNGVISATAIVSTGMESDALSTAFFVMGEEAVRAYCNKHRNVRCVLFVESGAETEVLYFNFDDEAEKESR